MITEDYCSFEVSKLLKEKGFDGECSRFYMPTGNGRWKYAHYHDFDISDRIDCPTHQMAMSWLREEHNIFIEIGTSIDLNGKYHFNYTILDKECKYVRRGYTDFDWNYEEAVEASLKYCLEKLI